MKMRRIELLLALILAQLVILVICTVAALLAPPPTVNDFIQYIDHDQGVACYALWSLFHRELDCLVLTP